MNAYKLISEIYRLIGEVEQTTISETLSQETPREIRSILKAIIDARRSLDAMSTPSKPTQSTEQPLPAQKTDTATTSHVELIRAQPEEPTTIDAVLARSPALTNEKLIRALSRSGIPIRATTKDSRKMIIKKAKHTLSAFPIIQQQKALLFLKQLIETDETKGWMELIHPTRDR